MAALLGSACAIKAEYRTEAQARLSSGRGAAAIPVDIEFQDGGVVDEAVDGRDRHGLVGKDLLPGAEGLVCDDAGAAGFKATRDQLEEHTRFFTQSVCLASAAGLKDAADCSAASDTARQAQNPRSRECGIVQTGRMLPVQTEHSAWAACGNAASSDRRFMLAAAVLVGQTFLMEELQRGNWIGERDRLSYRSVS